MTRGPQKEPMRVPGLAAKHGVRVAAEQGVLAVVEAMKSAPWTLRQVRLALRLGRQKLIDQWGDRARSAWYRAVVTVCGVKVTKIRDLRQLKIKGLEDER